METELKHLYVPSVSSNEAFTTALGCFTSQELAWDVLKHFLQQQTDDTMQTASIVQWTIDVVGEEGFEVLVTLQSRECPACRRSTFWIDFDASKGQCHQLACQAWIEEKGEEHVDCGWPPVHFSTKVSSLEEAMQTLHERGSEVEAAGQPHSEIQHLDESEHNW